MLTRSHLGHHASIAGVELDLRGDDVGEDTLSVLHHGCGGLVARAFDTQNTHLITSVVRGKD
jgi:hypothetical protein